MVKRTYRQGRAVVEEGAVKRLGVLRLAYLAGDPRAGYNGGI
jgi:hypothetical protein